MTTNSAHPDPGLLLDQMGFLRRLSRSLVDEEAAAQDLAQEALVKALERPPRRTESIQAWFRAVLIGDSRQARRRAGRRRDRERRAARADALPSAVEVVERQELLAHLFAALRGLEEPYRSAIHHRYLDELPPREIARRLDLSVETVKWRLRKGLADLRVALDGKYRNDRHAWMSGLAVMIGIPAPTSPTTYATLSLGGLLMGMKSKYVLGPVLFLLLCAGGWWFVSAGDPMLPGMEEKAPVQAAKAPGGAPVPEGRRELTVEGTGGAAAAPVTAVMEHKVEGMVINSAGRPVAGVALTCIPLAPAPPGSRADRRWRSGKDGCFQARLGFPNGFVEVEDPRWATVLKGVFGRVDGVDRPEPLVVVGRSVCMTGRVTAAGGEPLVGATIQYTIPREFGLDLSRSLISSQFNPFGGRRVDKQGRFDLEKLAAVKGAELLFRCPGYLPYRIPVTSGGGTGLEVVLERVAPQPGRVYGHLFDPEGRGVSGARLCLGRATAVTGEGGSFSLGLSRVGESRVIHAIARNYLPTNHTLSQEEVERAREVGCQVELGFTGRPLAISGRVTTRAGTPLAGVKVWALEPDLFPRYDGNRVAVEGFLAGGLTRADFMRRFVKNGRPTISLDQVRRDHPNSRWGWVLTDEQGRFKLGGLQDRPYRLGALRQDSLLRGAGGPFPAGSRGVVIRLDTRRVVPRVAGRVVTAQGRGLVGVRVRIRSDVSRLTITKGRRYSTFWTPGKEVVTGADGRFVLTEVAPADCYLEFSGPKVITGFLGQEVEGGLAAAVASVESIRHTVYRRVRFSLRLDDPSVADQVAVLDRAGRQLFMTQYSAGGRRSSNRYPISNGRTGPILTSEAAVTVVIYMGDHEVGRLPVALTPEGANQLAW